MPQQSRVIQPLEFLKDNVYNEKGDVWQLGLLLYKIIQLDPLFDAVF